MADACFHTSRGTKHRARLLRNRGRLPSRTQAPRRKRRRRAGWQSAARWIRPCTNWIFAGVSPGTCGRKRDSTRPWRTTSRPSRDPDFALAHAGRNGDRARAEMILSDLRTRKPPPVISLAQWYAVAGQPDAAIEMLSRGIPAGSIPTPVGVDPMCDGIRLDPRFAELIAKRQITQRAARIDRAGPSRSRRD